jgi:hypothetical protein
MMWLYLFAAVSWMEVEPEGPIIGAKWCGFDGSSDVLAQLGLKAAAWAWLQAAWAFRICKPGPSRY